MFKTEIDTAGLLRYDYGEVIPMKEERLAYLREYKKAKLRRVPLDMKPEEYAALVRAAKFAEQSVMGYVKDAIRQRMKNEGQA